MGQTFHLTCPDAKLYLWVGQNTAGNPDGMTILYSGEKYTPRLHRFLRATMGKALYLHESHDCDYAWEEFPEFEGDD